MILGLTSTIVPRGAMRVFGCVTLLALIASSCGRDVADDDQLLAPPTVASSAIAPKVIILAIDGPRHSETLGDPSHQYVPEMWSQLKPLGAIVDNFRNTGVTKTMPGHSALLTGTWQPIANDGSERPDMPTLFEYYRNQTGAPASKTAIIGGKTKLASLSYSTHASYGSSLGASVSVGLASDDDVGQQLIATLQTDQPVIALVALSQVDQGAHSGVWQTYLDRIATADSIAVAVWNYLQSDPFYQDQTYLFITADHGRHDDQNGGFKSHGDSCEGCQRIIFLALGPNIRPDYVVGSTQVYTQRDLCPTIGQILGIAVPEADGTVITPIFKPVGTGIP